MSVPFDLVEMVDHWTTTPEDEFVWKGGHYDLVKQISEVMLDFPETPEGAKFVLDPPELYDRVILVSGGFDSTICWLLNRDHPGSTQALYVNTGQDYSDKEQAALKDFGVPFESEEWEFPDRHPEWKHIIPGRNFVLLSMAEEWVKHEGEIWIGVVSGESSPDSGDKSPLFFRLFEDLIWRSKNKKITIKTIANKTKNDWLQWYFDKFHDWKILQTVTCFSDTEKHCGRCQACLRKWIQMRYCKVPEPLFEMFEIDPFVGAKEYVEKYLSTLQRVLDTRDFSHYTKERAEQDLEVLSLRLVDGF